MHVTCLVVRTAYHAASCEPEENRGNDGAKELSNPVEDGPDERDPTANKSSERDCRVDVAAGDVEGHRYRDEEGQSMGDGHRDQASSSGGVFVELLCSHKSNKAYTITRTHARKQASKWYCCCLPRERTEPSAAKTKMAVATNSARAARMVSGW